VTSPARQFDVVSQCRQALDLEARSFFEKPAFRASALSAMMSARRLTSLMFVPNDDWHCLKPSSFAASMQANCRKITLPMAVR